MPQLSYYTTSTKVLGPGNRFAIWFQGCKKNCIGCINPQGRIIGGGFYLSVDELADKITATKNITGLTISGGEPFLQAEELDALLTKVKAKRDLDVIVYSGYRYAELLKIHGKKIFDSIDILIDGEYIEAENNNTPFIGSDNQQIVFLTEKGKTLESNFKKTKTRDVEMEITKDAEIFLIGIPPKNFYDTLLQKLAIET